MVAISCKSIHSRAANFSLNKVRAATYPLVFLVAFGGATACGPRVMPNYLKDNDVLLQRVVTEEDLRKLKKNFDQNPE